MFDEGRQVKGAGLLQLDVYADSFAEDRVGHRDGRGDGDSRMCRHGILDLHRADVLAATEDEVRCPAGEREIAVGVEFADVTHPHPAVRGVELVVVGAAEIAEGECGPAAYGLSASGVGDIAV